MSRRGARAVPAGELLPFDAPPAPRPAATGGEGEARRIFLGWDAPALPAAARWLHAERGPDLHALLIALPGSRAVRRLTELLARAAPPGSRPPRIVTQGALVDELVRLERPAAGRLARTLAWRRALEGLSGADLERLARGATRRADAESRLRLADTVRALHGLLAPEGLDFEDLAGAERGPDHDAERARWRVLAKAQAAWRATLGACDLADPHEARRAAIDAGRVDLEREVVLVGVADMNELLAALLRRLGARATALVVAPPEHAAGFDALGRLVPAHWAEQRVPLDARTWFVEEKPSDQAERVEQLLGTWCERHPAEAVTIGLADDEVAPYLERRLRAAGARLRIAAGTPIARTRPYKLLRAAAELSERRGFAELAALARHPDAAPLLAAGYDPAEVLDGYHADHLPHAAGDWPGSDSDTRGVRALWGSVERLLGELAGQQRGDLARWARAGRALLERVYGAAPLDPEVEEQRVVAGALRLLAEALEELEGLPPGLAGEPVLAHDALRLVLRGLRGATVPPAPARPGEPTVEALGWLELPLDDAPALVVTGFNEGRVPQSVQGDPFLPDALRTRLGLPDDAARLARDLYATLVLLASRSDRAFVTGRRARSGDPLVPSRIAFQAPEDEVAARVRIFLPPDVRPEPARTAVEQPAFNRPRWREEAAPAVFSITSLRTFLRSPYLYYLEHVLRLRSRDDRARELEPLHFGILAHDALQALGRGAALDVIDPRQLEDLLVAELERVAAERYGQAPLPTVALQLEQLKYRLRRVAELEAERRRAGWRILCVEHKVDSFELDVDGTPAILRGRIDRIDAHEDGRRWSILDYKTGDAGDTPEKTARGKEGWKDLQLPLYRLIAAPFAREHGLAGEPELGYFHVG